MIVVLSMRMQAACRENSTRGSLRMHERVDASMSTTLSRYLRDFSAEPPPSCGDSGYASFEETVALSRKPAAAPPVDIEAERREAYAQGHEAATQELDAKRIRRSWTADRWKHIAGETRCIAARRFEDRAAEKIAAGLTRLATVLGQAISTEAAPPRLRPILIRSADG